MKNYLKNFQSILYILHQNILHADSSVWTIVKKGRLYLAFLCFLLLFVWMGSPLLWSKDRLWAAPDRQHNALFSMILKDHVRQGRVRYAAIKKDARFSRYMQLLGRSKPNSIKGKNSQLAYWINIYNAFTLKLIVDNYPLKSIEELHSGPTAFAHLAGKTIWDKWHFKIDGRQYTLNQVEHKIIRPRYKDPRVHAALVCAANSCPPLRAEAYSGKHLDRQLNEQMRIWLRDRSKNYYDRKQNVLHLSKIFDWFEEDFVKKGGNIGEAILPYLPPSTKTHLQKNSKGLRIRYLKYDWSLNEA